MNSLQQMLLGGEVERKEPGATPFGGLSGALGVAKVEFSPAFLTRGMAEERGTKAKQKGKKKKAPKLPNYMTDLPDMSKPPGGEEPEAADGIKPGWRSGLGLMTDMGL